MIYPQKYPCIELKVKPHKLSTFIKNLKKKKSYLRKKYNNHSANFSQRNIIIIQPTSVVFLTFGRVKCAVSLEIGMLLRELPGPMKADSTCLKGFAANSEGVNRLLLVVTNCC